MYQLDPETIRELNQTSFFPKSFNVRSCSSSRPLSLRSLISTSIDSLPSDLIAVIGGELTDQYQQYSALAFLTDLPHMEIGKVSCDTIVTLKPLSLTGLEHLFHFGGIPPLDFHRLFNCYSSDLFTAALFVLSEVCSHGNAKPHIRCHQPMTIEFKRSTKSQCDIEFFKTERSFIFRSLFSSLVFPLKRLREKQIAFSHRHFRSTCKHVEESPITQTDLSIVYPKLNSNNLYHVLPDLKKQEIPTKLDLQRQTSDNTCVVEAVVRLHEVEITSSLDDTVKCISEFSLPMILHPYLVLPRRQFEGAWCITSSFDLKTESSSSFTDETIHFLSSKKICEKQDCTNDSFNWFTRCFIPLKWRKEKDGTEDFLNGFKHKTISICGNFCPISLKNEIAFSVAEESGISESELTVIMKNYNKRMFFLPRKIICYLANKHIHSLFYAFDWIRLNIYQTEFRVSPTTLVPLTSASLFCTNPSLFADSEKKEPALHYDSFSLVLALSPEGCFPQRRWCLAKDFKFHVPKTKI